MCGRYWTVKRKAERVSLLVVVKYNLSAGEV